MSIESIYRWHDGALEALEYCDMADTVLDAADSWLVTDGTALALGLHRDRFLAAIPRTHSAALRAEEFWDASIESIPREGDWFPRVELQRRSGALLLVFRLRTAPERSNHVALTTWSGPDPRSRPTVKGPDLAAMVRVRTAIQPLGAGEAVILSPEGYVIEGAYSALAWWRGNILCSPPSDFERVDSVTFRSVSALAAALGVQTWQEAVTPAEIADTEVWSMTALHGIRIVTEWIDGPAVAQLPGRLPRWRARMDALRKPL
jgi:branched-subunit amino acid aminotransferase/4-amino-4-deoxychorismate lyase